MLAHDGKVVVRKAFYKLRALIRAYEADHKAFGAASPFVVHFRWATHGSRAEQNVHPHSLDNGRAGLAHNGVLYDFLPPFKADISDTVWFCRTVLTSRSAEQLVDQDFGNMLAEMIGEFNKLVILAHDSEAIIVNADAGKWEGGRWFSNTDYQAPPKKLVLVQSSEPVSRNLLWGHDDYFRVESSLHELGDDEQHLGDALQDEWEKVRDLLIDERYRDCHTPEDWDALDEDAWKIACENMNISEAAAATE